MRKSTAAARIRALGVPVCDADSIVHKLYKSGGAAVAPIAQAFPGTMSEDGGIDRQKLATSLLADASAYAKLEAIVHPAVRRGIDDFFAGLPSDTPFAVADIPLLYETDRAADFDAVIVAACPPEMQVSRVMARAWRDLSASAKSRSCSLRQAAFALAVERVARATELRGV